MKWSRLGISFVLARANRAELNLTGMQCLQHFTAHGAGPVSIGTSGARSSFIVIHRSLRKFLRCISQECQVGIVGDSFWRNLMQRRLRNSALA